MEEYLYRYISFETFVGMIQDQALTFVLPELWDDPKEGAALENALSSLKTVYERLMFLSMRSKTFCQCWTTLEESDAMWRIYNYGNRSLRIKTSFSKARQLNNVDIIPVIYSNDPMPFKEEEKFDFRKAISCKRLAFEHEKEIRLIQHYRFTSTEDCEHHIKATWALYDETKRMQLLDSLYPGKSVEEQVEATVKLLNVGKNRECTRHISFSHIPDFIEGVLVNPFAPDWYVDIVKQYCSLNSIHFEGKSTLYQSD